jgi:hypothetical protein
MAALRQHPGKSRAGGPAGGGPESAPPLPRIEHPGAAPGGVVRRDGID